MAQFALLLNHTPDRYEGMTEDDYMAIIKDYVAWVEKATAKGRYLGGHKLASEAGKVLRPDGGAVEIHDSPFAELTEVLGGLMVIEAKDYDDAIALVRDHPHLAYNNTMEIRRIDGE